MAHSGASASIPTEKTAKPVLVFPFTLSAHDNGHFVSSPRGFDAAFKAAKPEGLSWYAFDVTVHSPTEVTFTPYGMACMAYGGIGAAKPSFSAVVTAEVTRPAIVRVATNLARWRRKAELEAAEDAIVAAYASKILAEITPALPDTQVGMKPMQSAECTKQSGEPNV